jgi:hypothetical protein
LEAICRKKEVDEMKTMTKEFAQLAVQLAGGSYQIVSNEGNWRELSGSPGLYIASTYFDLAGLTMDDKTLFFQGAAVQELKNPTFFPATAGNTLQIADVMSVVPLTDTQAGSYLFGANYNVSNSSDITFHETVFGRVRVFNMDLDNLAGGFTILLSDTQTGALEPTASDRIYCYRVVQYNGADTRFDVFPARYILRADSKEEPEFEYLMRLKRSYELQNEPDRD